jgi:hypothetical protein
VSYVYTVQFGQCDGRGGQSAFGWLFTNLQISNREQIAFFLSRHRSNLPHPTVRRYISNSNIHQIRKSTNPPEINTYVISNRNKTRLLRPPWRNGFFANLHNPTGGNFIAALARARREFPRKSRYQSAQNQPRRVI